ncbi:hypothetical protein MSG28_000028 [Choristoneura fumiferana]|uniref:Uncharacterized protein n=1 Tax=Choristoneura fumiferana TaxID=7141 RepID=A0ACC0JZ67_CHOFU|nr:hypothetical protein MSG28_000028 [Choristoneura fumiferana]
MYNPQEEEVMELLHKLPKLAEKFEVHRKIGEGTFSSVFLGSLRQESGLPDSKKRWYAIKHLVPTTHPTRVAHELRCLREIGGKNHVIGVDLCLRNFDSVVFIMPYIPHRKFTEYVGEMDTDELRQYMRALMTALRHVHSFGVIHRDVKPSNFLYNRDKRLYALVDFGLAQHTSSDAQPPPAHQSLKRPREHGSPLPCAKRVALDLTMRTRKQNQPPVTEELAVTSDKELAQLFKSRVSIRAASGRAPRAEPYFVASPLALGPRLPLVDTRLKEPQSEPCLWQRLHLRGLGARQPLGPRLPLVDTRLKEPQSEPCLWQRLHCGLGARQPLGPRLPLVDTRLKEPQSEPCLWQRLHLRGLGARQPLGPRLPLVDTRLKEPQSEPCLWQRLHLRGLGARQPLGPRLPLVLPPAHYNPAAARAPCACSGVAGVCDECAAWAPRRANRAGTQGFRPPEVTTPPLVLFKYTDQTTAVDMWAAGVVLASVLTGRYPFFRASDDLDALREIAVLLGSQAMHRTAAALGQYQGERKIEDILFTFTLQVAALMSCTEPIAKALKATADSSRSAGCRLLTSISGPGLCLRKLAARLCDARAPAPLPRRAPLPDDVCCDCRLPRAMCICRDPSTMDNETFPNRSYAGFPDSAFALAYRLLEPEPQARITAAEALKHPFLASRFFITAVDYKLYLSGNADDGSELQLWITLISSLKDSNP